MTIEDDNITVVHTGETRHWLWNPETSEEIHAEMPDGNIMTTVRPKELPDGV